MGLHRGPRAGPSQGTGPFLPCSGGSRDEQGRSEFGRKSVSSPASPGQVAPVWEVLQRKKKKSSSLYSPRKFCPLFPDTFLKARRGTWGRGKEFRGLLQDQTQRSHRRTPTFPVPRKGLGLIKLQSPNPHPERARDSHLVSPRDPQEGGGR